ncbi:hypothetical protein GGR56DRAFT_443107 [Xylariaceae sp. FL0804]|nr:hypothetical protein GGR56DRAFT_443107 [Xylariaceae sp. FL0804]
MISSENGSLNLIHPFQNGPYNPSVASSASSSSASVWSDVASQNSDDTCTTSSCSDSSERCDSLCFTQQYVASQLEPQAAPAFTRKWSGTSAPAEVPRELRQNPRRTSRTACPPVLMRQSDRKINFVDNLVDSSTQIVEAIWPLSSVFQPHKLGSKVLPLRTFIQETLRRSRTSFSTLQVALYYLILVKPHVPEYDFTMEQPDDTHANKVLQCGRRMFLAGLILASKYLQDRNYSTRAWSKISGLAPQEINQNEMAFLHAVQWKLHITDDVFERWTEVMLKYTPSQPPSPGSARSLVVDQQVSDWKNLILQLNPGLENMEELLSSGPPSCRVREMQMASPRSMYPVSPMTPTPILPEENDATPTPRSYPTPSVMEPAPATVYTPGRAPALGLLPTPRLTPQSTGFSTPAVGAATSLLSGKSSMQYAMNQAASAFAAQNLDRWPGTINTSPQGYFDLRRSSLANSLSTASSPESMISDSSRTSRSSSISSASSLVSAPSSKLDVQARCRNAKLYGERYGLRPAIASVPETYEESRFTSSPESYTGTMGKDLCQLSLETPTARRGYDADTTDAARALGELHYSQSQPSARPRPVRLGSKRGRTSSVDNPLQDNVRDILRTQHCTHMENSDANGRLYSRPVLESSAHEGGGKRFCYSSGASLRTYSIPTMHPAVGGTGGPGMWEGILN